MEDDLERDAEAAWRALEEAAESEEDVDMEDELEKDAEIAWRDLEAENQMAEEVDMELERDAEAVWKELEAESHMDEEVDMEDELERDAEAAWKELEEDGAEDMADGPSIQYRCTLCGSTTGPTLRLKGRPKFLGFDKCRKADIDTQYCLGCSEHGAREFVVYDMVMKSIPLRSEQVRRRTIIHLLSLSSQGDRLLVADHFRICRCCLYPVALVGYLGSAAKVVGTSSVAAFAADLGMC